MTTNSDSAAVVLVTTVIDDRGKADAIARALVDARTVACVQISGAPVTSVYRWKGKVEAEEEWSVAAKTTAANAAAVVDQIRELHSYEVPEILVTPVLGGHGPYLEWVAAEVSATPSS
jgi:periplasmic divalent cation tolerance protein